MLRSREISTPSRRVLKSTSLNRFASISYVTARIIASNVILCSRTSGASDRILFRDAKRQSHVRSVNR